MSRRVFFSFHYERDYWRVNQVRNSWLTHGRANSFIDAANWEKIKRSGDNTIKKWIDSQLKGTSVTVVLIGKETSTRKYVQYEIEKSREKGNGLLGIYIHDLKDQFGNSAIFSGDNPFELFITRKGLFFDDTLADIYPTYSWVYDDGHNNLSNWIESAAIKAGR